VSFYSDSAAFSEVEIHIQTVDEEEPDQSKEGAVKASSYDYQNDGSWHQIVVPLSDMAGVNLKKVSAPFVLVGGGGDKNERLYVDNLYFTKE
jgi:hypothetical protein